MNLPDNADSIAQFHRYIAGQKPLLRNHYGQLLAQDLSRQQWDGCFQRNVLAVLAISIYTTSQAIDFIAIYQ